MYGDDLPEFKKVKTSYAQQFINGVLVGAGGGSLIKLEVFEDNHFRAIFKQSYFQLAKDNDMPSKSQWNTLKKKIKRRNHSVFVFREYGQIACGEEMPDSVVCLYLDFGFLYE